MLMMDDVSGANLILPLGRPREATEMAPRRYERLGVSPFASATSEVPSDQHLKGVRRRMSQMVEGVVSSEFRMQMVGYGLTTAEIHYHMPDHPSLLQLFVWQEYDLAPEFPELHSFLDYWTETLDGPLHSVRIAHHRLIEPSEWKAVDGIIAIH